jgi:glycosyltransferase involved in cell wall biosynthesis
MNISVIIPVYNAGKFLKKAVESALQQEETSEVLLIEDNSADDSLKICIALEQQYHNVKLYRHPDGVNKGAGATRNLGIKKAVCEYVAFLDADDYYLPERFIKAKKLFKKYPNIDGVYEAIGMHYYDALAKKKWFESGEKELTTVTEKIDPDNLFEALMIGGKGYLHLDGLVVKKSIFKRCGHFFESLRLHQDTAIFIQMSLFGNLVPGRLNVPVARRGIHQDNRILANYHRSKTVFLLWKNLFHWACQKRITKHRLKMLFHNYIYCALKFLKENSLFSLKALGLMKEAIQESARHPILFVEAAIYYVKK